MSSPSRRALEAFVRYGTFPLLAFGPVALVLAMLGPDAARSAPPGAGVLVASAGLVVVSYALLAALERILPHREDWNRPKNDLRADLAYLLVVGPASAFAGAFAAASLAVLLDEALPTALRLDLWPSDAHPVVQVLLAFLLAELGHYWAHRLGHEIPLLWRLHAVHHSARRLHWLNATRFHPLDLVLVALVQAFPLEVLGIPPGVYLAYFVGASCYGQLQHCNVDVDTRLFRGLFATPELHRWHHAQNPREGNTNYGAVLIAWDQLFRTRFWPGKPITEAVGIGGMPRFPDALVDQLLAPLRWARVVESSAADASYAPPETHTAPNLDSRG